MKNILIIYNILEILFVILSDRQFEKTLKQKVMIKKFIESKLKQAGNQNVSHTDILTSEEASEYLGITKRRLYALMELKKIQYVKYIKFAYFTKEDLDRFINESLKVVDREK